MFIEITTDKGKVSININSIRFFAPNENGCYFSLVNGADRSVGSLKAQEDYATVKAMIVKASKLP